jgi:hypothetical protein
VRLERVAKLRFTTRKQIRALAPIGEKSVAHVPGFFGFLLKSGFAEKPYRLLQQSEAARKNFRAAFLK